MRELIAIFATFLIASLVMTIAAGCNGKTIAGYSSHEELRRPKTGELLWQRDIGEKHQQELPANAAGPTTQSLGEDGINASLAGTHETTPEQIIAQNGKLFYFAAAGFAVLAVVAFGLLHSNSLGIAAIVAGVACAGTPLFLNNVGPWLLPIGVLALIVGGVWYVVERRASQRSSAVGGELLAQADAAANAGDTVAAVDKMRSATAALLVNKPVLARAVKAGV